MKKFWAVVSEEKRTGSEGSLGRMFHQFSHKHPTHDLAKQEAERLARLVPGVSFWTMELTGRARVEKPAAWVATESDSEATEEAIETDEDDDSRGVPF